MTVRKQSQRQEKSVAKQLNGRVTAASGATDFAKGDVRTDKFLVECKTTKQPYYTLSFKTWEKICREANKDGLRIPLMCVDIRGERCFVCDAELVPLILHCHVREDTQKSRRICGNLEFIVHSPYRLAVLPDYVFERYVLPTI